MVRTHAPSRHSLMLSSNEPVKMRPSGATATDITTLVCPASVTTSPENGRNLRASFAASQSAWHVGATAAMSWASVSWYSTRPRASVGSAMSCAAARAAERAARVVGIAAKSRRVEVGAQVGIVARDHLMLPADRTAAHEEELVNFFEGL